MSIILPARARVADEYATSDIRWLEIHEADGGYFLFQYVDVRRPPKWDSFCDDLENLLSDCKEYWGVEAGAWKTVAE